MICIGVDPGLHTTAWAVVRSAQKDPDVPLRVITLGLWTADWGLHGGDVVIDMIRNIDPFLSPKTGIDRIVVESQQVYEGKNRKGKPEDLIRLATISGAVLRTFSGVPQQINPVPQAWKGSVEKVVPQARACVALGWTFKTMGGKDPKKQHVVPT